MDSSETRMNAAATPAPRAAGTGTELPLGDGLGAFCPHCGTRRTPGVTTCSNCGGALGAGTTQEAEWWKTAKERAGQVARDLGMVLMHLGRDPINGIGGAYAKLENPLRIRLVGAALTLLSIFMIVVALSIALSRWSMGLLGAGGANLPAVSLFLALLALPLVLGGASHLLRRILLRTSITPDADLFSAAVALVPVALALFLGSLLGLGNVEILVFLVLLGSILATLMLFTAWTEVGGMAKAPAAWSLPFALAAALWACKVVFVAFLG